MSVYAIFLVKMEWFQPFKDWNICEKWFLIQSTNQSFSKSKDKDARMPSIWPFTWFYGENISNISVKAD